MQCSLSGFIDLDVFAGWEPGPREILIGVGRALLGLLCAAILAGCFSGPDPAKYPYRLRQTGQTGTVRFADLDQDGRPEEINTKEWGRKNGDPMRRSAVTLKVHGGRTIEQVNYAGDLVASIHVLDIGRDGRQEVIVPFVRNDSLFLSVVSATGTKRQQFFVTAGSPRREPEGTLPWDPEVRAVYQTDATGDGETELVTVMMTRLARTPRGFWVHDLETGERLASWTSGAMIDAFALRDGVGEGQLDLLCASSASNNGARGGGLDDQHAYLFRVALGSSPTLEWKRELGGLWARARLHHGDLDGDGNEEWVAVRLYHDGRPAPDQLEVFDPETGESMRNVQFNPGAKGVRVANLSGKRADEVVVLRGDHRVELRGPDLTTKRSRQFESDLGGISVVSTLGQDGTDRVVVRGTEESWILGPGLETEAYLPASLSDWRLMPSSQSFLSEAPNVIAEAEGDTRVYAYVENSIYLLHRYGPWALWLFVLAGVGGLVWLGWGHYRRYRALREERSRLLEKSRSARLLVGPDASVEQANDQACSLLGISDPSPDDSFLREQMPTLREFLEDTVSNGKAPREEHLRLGPGGQPTRVRAEPLTRNSDDPRNEERRWLVDLGADEDADPEPWRLMAQRVAHDLKNPLTSILLTVRRLRNEHQDRAPEIADELAPYTERVEDRIRHLRRMTLNFMKLVGDEGPSLAKGNLAKLVRSVAEELRKDLASDIRLTVEIEDEPPSSYFDRDQIESVLENLVSNATDALSEGGEITLSLWVERDLQPGSDTEPGDYAVIEVVDTGEGMDSETAAQAFEPGFGTNEEGAGLGLSIVKKIADDHGGTVELETDQGLGTAVTVYLPVSTTPRPEGAP